jgi:hypothetical protein
VRNRTYRRIAALLALCALAFSQLALSAHTCHGTAHVPASPASATEPAAPCEGMQGPMDHEANVCDQHCQYGHANVDKVLSPVAAFDSAAQPLRVAPAAPSFAGITAATLRRPAPASTPPPLLLFGTLRI